MSVSECDMGYGGSRDSGCVMCDFGQYKSDINDVACTSCGGDAFSTNNTASTAMADCGKYFCAFKHFSFITLLLIKSSY